MGNFPIRQLLPGHVPINEARQCGEYPAMPKPRNPRPGLKNPIYGRVEQRLEKLGISESRAAIDAGLGADAIRDMRRRSKNMPRVDTLDALSRVLRTTPEWLAYGAGNEEIGGTVVDQPGIPVQGEVAAGLWLEIDLPDEHPHSTIPFAFDTRFPRAAQYALRVRGTSVNRIARPDDYLICLDIGQTGVEPGEGSLVIVERRRGQAGQREVTAKRIRRDGRLVKLFPDSDDPRWQEPLIFDPKHAGEDEEIVIVALVTGVFREISSQ